MSARRRSGIHNEWRRSLSMLVRLSFDLHERVVAAVAAVASCSRLAKRFGVSLSSAPLGRALPPGQPDRGQSIRPRPRLMIVDNLGPTRWRACARRSRRRACPLPPALPPVFQPGRAGVRQVEGAAAHRGDAHRARAAGHHLARLHTLCSARVPQLPGCCRI